MCKRGPQSQTTGEDTTASTLPPAPKGKENDVREKDPRAVEQHPREPRRPATSVDLTEKGACALLKSIFLFHWVCVVGSAVEQPCHHNSREKTQGFSMMNDWYSTSSVELHTSGTWHSCVRDHDAVEVLHTDGVQQEKENYLRRNQFFICVVALETDDHFKRCCCALWTTDVGRMIFGNIN